MYVQDVNMRACVHECVCVCVFVLYICMSVYVCT